jgi:hypothetical protein
MIVAPQPEGTMRGREQQVERRIRLWVVQQERDRLSVRAPERDRAQATERTEQQRLQAAARANKR